MTTHNVPMDGKGKGFPVDAWCVAIDDTKHWCLPTGFAKHIDKIMSVYVTDRNLHTYCCELFPSLYLEPLSSAVYFKEGTPDDLMEQVNSMILDNDVLEGTYMHVSDVDKIPDTQLHHLGEVETLEDAREYYQGNPVF